MDRKFAVGMLYPKFLYLFSDVICYVTRNPRGWAELVHNLLQWATIAAQHAVNQYALPAAVLVLNGPPTGKLDWMGEDTNALTEEFFRAVEGQMTESAFVKDLAEQVLPFLLSLQAGLTNRLVRCQERGRDISPVLL